MIKFTLITPFPEMFPAFLGLSLAGDALSKGKWSFETVNLRDFGIGKHKNIDDSPYGGGAGMVIRADVIGTALESINGYETARKIYMSPRGVQLKQAISAKIATQEHIIILCGRFEGIDERALTYYNFEEISIGDYVLSGGEPAALALMDSVIRLLPEVMGNPETAGDESFSNGLLEYPHYTRPAEWNEQKVPEILTSGDHKKVADWRHEKSLEITKNRRPDLLVKK